MSSHSLKGCVYLIPTPLYETALQSLPAEVMEALGRIRYFYAEKATTARRFIKKLLPDVDLKTRIWLEIDKHRPVSLEPLRQWLLAGAEVGILSEAGCPGIADPGQLLVAEAHRLGARVIPLTGPNALILALMASGMNGQQFRFCGYLPVESKQRRQMIQALERRVQETGETQIFIETPYRNQQLLTALLQQLHPQTWLCVAAELTSPHAFIQSAPISQWRTSALPNLHKKPSVFLIGLPAHAA
ncbi:MAG: SAM-dependent methyltransferase [Thermoflavifilum sp.]|nr:SAM-dependent methyltransferase [Thermoflavifilum sp.]